MTKTGKVIKFNMKKVFLLFIFISFFMSYGAVSQSHEKKKSTQKHRKVDKRKRELSFREALLLTIIKRNTVFSREFDVTEKKYINLTTVHLYLNNQERICVYEDRWPKGDPNWIYILDDIQYQLN